MHPNQQQGQQWPPHQQPAQPYGQPQRPPYPPYPPHRARKKGMPVWGIVGLAVAGLVALGGIGTVIDAVVSDGPAATASASPSAAVAVPEYKVVKTRRNAVDLLVPKATVASAQAAIHDWLEQNADGHDYLSVMVVRSANAKTYVCSAEYVADERTSQIKTGGRITADEYPATVMNCPDPGGS